MVLAKQFLICILSLPITTWISPSEKKVSAFSRLTTGVRSSLLFCGAVIDDPELTKERYTQNNLIEFGIIVNGICMKPIHHTSRSLRKVYINELRMVLNDAIVCFCRIEILDQMIPHTPLPYDLCAVRKYGLYFNNSLRPNCLICKAIWISALSEAICLRFQLPHNG